MRLQTYKCGKTMLLKYLSIIWKHSVVYKKGKTRKTQILEKNLSSMTISPHVQYLCKSHHCSSLVIF